MPRPKQTRLIRDLKVDGDNVNHFASCDTIGELLAKAQELIVDHFALNGGELPIIGQITFRVGNDRYMVTLKPDIREIK